MPGIAGFVTAVLRDSRPEVCAETLRAMRQRIRYDESYLDDELFVSERIACTRTHVGLLEKQPQPVRRGDLVAWLDGEIYNGEELRRRYDLPECDGSAELFLACVTANPAGEFLPSVDGVYFAVVHNERTGDTSLYTDRHGFKGAYFAELPGGVAWASEVKAFLPLPGIDAAPNPEMLDVFWSKGGPAGELTWVRGVAPLPSASVCTWSAAKQSFSKTAYWTWRDIPPHPAETSLDDAAEEFAKRFVDAVDRLRRVPEGVRVGVSLSGGLDSRAIADVASRSGPLRTVTISGPDSDDRRIAARVAEKIGSTHSVAVIEPDGWLRGRLRMAWRIDGHVDLLHFHATAALKELHEAWDLNLNGFLGDATVGGSYFHDDSVESFWRLFADRGRRWLSAGLRQGEVYGYERIPFLANDVMDWAIVVPVAQLRRSRFYTRALKHILRREVAAIPWATNGMPVGSSVALQRLGVRLKNLRRRVRRVLGVSYPKSFIDYDVCMNTPSTRECVRRLLGAPGAKVHAMSIGDRVAELVATPQPWDGEEQKLVTRAMTIEVWARCAASSDVDTTLAELDDIEAIVGASPMGG